MDDNVIAGRNSVLEALKSGREIDKIFIQKGQREGSILKIIAIAKEKKIPCVDAQPQKLFALSNVQNHQGVCALVRQTKDYTLDDIIEYAKEKNEKPFICVLDGVEDEHNMGAVIRSANVMGVHGVIIPKRNSATLSPLVAKVASGALEYIKVCRVTNIASTLDILKEKNIWVFGACGEAEKKCYDEDFDCPCAIVIGNEAKGISRLVREKCDFLVSIPMDEGSVGSLNASCAAAVMFYEVKRQREKKGE